jgi:protein-S-isoprenylcysteine O-methyltransferase Ste14
MMSTVQTIYTAAASWSWVVLVLVWLTGCFRSKPAVRTPYRGRQAVASALLVGGFALLLSPRVRSIGPLGVPITPEPPWLGGLGLAVDLAGIALAIWARLTLGSNWSGLITVKADHELIRTGPYALVRHPIYTGLLAASVGTALTIGRVAAYLGAASCLVAILMRVHGEDALMAEQFPASHSAYRDRTKALIPFVW